MRQYLELLKDVRDNGRAKEDRTGTGTRAVFGRQIRMDLAEGFPLLTTKKMFTKGILAELLWILSGDTNVNTLKAQGVHIWDEWADTETGDLGRVYGAQWRNWTSLGSRGVPRYTDQMVNLINDLKSNPTSRRHIVTAWNPGELHLMALPPCHMMFQFYCEELTVEERFKLLDSQDYESAAWANHTHQCEKACDTFNIPRYRLSCQLYQRSADIFLGVPFNIASYAALTMMVAQVVNMVPGDFVHTFGDLHIYNNHFDQVDQQLQREPFPLPKLELNPKVKDLFAFTLEDFKLVGYESHPAIKAEVSV